MKRFRYLLLIALLLCRPALAAEPVIMVFGDSLSAAYGMPVNQGWVSLLQQRLHEEKLPYRIANASISGETTSGGLSRMAAALHQHSPMIVLLELGANDGLRGLPIAEMRQNLSDMIRAGRAAGAQVLLIGMMIPPNYGPRYAHEFSDSYRLLARQFKLPLLPFLLDGVAAKPGLMQDDGLHPNAAAQAAVMQNVWRVLRPLLGH